MDEYERNRVSKEFADRMARLVEAAALASAGQAAGRPMSSLQTDVDRLWETLISCIAILATIERRLDS